MKPSEMIVNYEEHTSKKLHEIEMSATMAAFNVNRALESGVISADGAKALRAALEDIREIRDKLTKNDFSAYDLIKQNLGGK